MKPNKKQLKLMKQAWGLLQATEAKFYKKIRFMEDALSEETGIDGLEFFMSDGSFVGIGTLDRRMKLIQKEELE